MGPPLFRCDATSPTVILCVDRVGKNTWSTCRTLSAGQNRHDILVPRKLAKQADQRIAASIADLKAPGMLKETIILIGGDFGRTPAVEARGRINVQNGRGHNS